MSITFVALNNANVSGVRELLVRWWKRDWSEENAESYFAWRYGERVGGETLLACDGGRYVGILDSFIRPYWIAGCRSAVRETCDWFCLPEYRKLGVGLHLMRLMMAKSQPVLNIGGTEITQELLPRLRWERLPDVDNFVLPVSLRMAAGLALQRLWPRGLGLSCLVPRMRLVRRLKRHPPPSADTQVVACGLVQREEIGRVPAYVLAPAVDISTLEWLGRAPAVVGEFVLLNFFCNGQLIGLSISRLQMLPFGCKALIVHWHAASLEVTDWIISETVHHLIERGADAVLCRASCPIACGALVRLGFFRNRPTPVYWRPVNELLPCGLLHLTSLRADDAFQFA